MQCRWLDTPSYVENISSRGDLSLGVNMGSFFFCVPQLIYLWGSPLWVRFLRMWPFFNPTIKVVTFRLRGWCVLGVFLLPAFTRLGHERQDLLSPCDEIHVCAQTRPWFILSSERVFGGMEFEPMLTPREKSPLPENVPRGGSNPRRCGQPAQALPTELFRPPTWVLIPFPHNSFGWEYKPRSSLCTHAFHHTDSIDPDIHVLDGWMPATKTHATCTIHEDGMCGDYLNGWIEQKWSHTQKSHRNWWTQRL